MTNDKDALDQVRPASGNAETARHADAPLKSRPVIKPKIVSLEIDEDFFEGGDPYNHTGSHYVNKLRD